jgi:hypothetical protein
VLQSFDNILLLNVSLLQVRDWCPTRSLQSISQANDASHSKVNHIFRYSFTGGINFVVLFLVLESILIIFLLVLLN